MSNGEDRPNYEKLKSWLYIVRTQAGFRQAVKEYSGPDFDMGYLRGFPQSYPALVMFSDGYEGYHFTEASCIPINELTAKIAEHEAKYGNKNDA